MNIPVLATPTQTMTTRQIAEVVNSRHADVMRAVDRLIEKSVIQGYAPTAYTHPQNGQTYYEYHINERDSYIIVAQLCPEYTAKLVDYWMATKSQAPTIPQTLPEALRLAADLAEQKAKVEQQLAIAAPKADYYDAVVDRANLLNATQVAQKMRMSAMQMNKHLDALDVYNKSVKRSRVFQQWFIDKGYGVIRQTELGYPQAMFTLEGEAWIVRKLVSEGVAA